MCFYFHTHNHFFLSPFFPYLTCSPLPVWVSIAAGVSMAMACNAMLQKATHGLNVFSSTRVAISIPELRVIPLNAADSLSPGVPPLPADYKKEMKSIHPHTPLSAVHPQPSSSLLVFADFLWNNFWSKSLFFPGLFLVGVINPRASLFYLLDNYK